ncbi:hypothetical protein JZ751_019303, partial [Albula glossodonta]
MAQNSDGDTEIYETLPVFPALTGPWRLAAVCSTGSKPSGRPTGTSSLTLRFSQQTETGPIVTRLKDKLAFSERRESSGVTLPLQPCVPAQHDPDLSSTATASRAARSPEGQI